RRAVVAVERPAIETVRDEHVLGQGVLDRHDRPVAVEAAEDQMRWRRIRFERRLDDRAVEGLERDALPPQVRRGPPRDAMEVGGKLSARKRRELGHRHRQGLDHVAAELVCRLLLEKKKTVTSIPWAASSSAAANPDWQL